MVLSPRLSIYGMKRGNPKPDRRLINYININKYQGRDAANVYNCSTRIVAGPVCLAGLGPGFIYII